MKNQTTPPARSSKKATRPRRVRADGWTLPRQRQFLKMLAVYGSVDQACQSVGMSVSSAYRLRLHPDGEAFRNAWATALQACVPTLREIAFDRAINGTDQPLFEHGVMVGYEKVYSDRLLMFLLRAYDTRPSASDVRLHGGWQQAALVSSFNKLKPVDDPKSEMPPQKAQPSSPEVDPASALKPYPPAGYTAPPMYTEVRETPSSDDYPPEIFA